MFISPQLCTRVAGHACLVAPGYVAELKLDGQRIQLHIAGHRTVAAFSRARRDLLGYAGLGWLQMADDDPESPARCRGFARGAPK